MAQIEGDTRICLKNGLDAIAYVHGIYGDAEMQIPCSHGIRTALTERHEELFGPDVGLGAKYERIDPRDLPNGAW